MTKVKTLKMIWTWLAITSVLSISMLSSVYAADNSFNVDSLINSISTSASANTWVNNTWVNNTVDTTNTIKVIKTNNWYEIQNWNKDYVLQFHTNKDVKIKSNTLQVNDKSNWDKIPSILESNIRVYKVGDTLLKWNHYYVELGWNYNDTVFVKDPSLTFDKIIQKTNGWIDSINWKVVYTFNNITTPKVETVKTTQIVKKKTWIENNLMLVAILLLVLWLGISIKRKA